MGDLYSSNYKQTFQKLNILNPFKYIYLLESLLVKRLEKQIFTDFDKIILFSEDEIRKIDKSFTKKIIHMNLSIEKIFMNQNKKIYKGEKVSDIFSDLLGGSEGPLKVGLNYLQGDKSDILDIKTEDRFGVTLSTEISDKILFNGKIGVPIGGIEETLIIGDVQIDFILNQDGSLKAKVFNRENEFRYIGDKLGYTQGVGLTYQVDFQTFRDLISRLVEKNK